MAKNGGIVDTTFSFDTSGKSKKRSGLSPTVGGDKTGLFSAENLISTQPATGAEAVTNSINAINFDPGSLTDTGAISFEGQGGAGDPIVPNKDLGLDEFRGQIFENFLAALTPLFGGLLTEEIASPGAPVSTSLGDIGQYVPEISDVQALFQERFGDDFSLTAPSFQGVDAINAVAKAIGIDPQKFLDPEFVGTTDAKFSVADDPALAAFATDTQAELEKLTEQLVAEQASRGILRSGGTDRLLGNLGETAQRSVAREAGRIASPVLQQQFIAKNILDPQRQTSFNTVIADLLSKISGSEQQTQLTASQIKAREEQGIIDRGLDLSKDRATKQEGQAARIADLKLQERMRNIVDEQALADYPLEAQRSNMGDLMSRINFVLGTLLKGNEGASFQAEQDRKEREEEKKDRRYQALYGFLTGSG